MKAVFNFQIKIDDKQSSVLFSMDECKGVDVELMSSLSKTFIDTKTKINKELKKGGTKEKKNSDSSSGSDASGEQESAK